jgi:hypothetical protein
VAQLTTAGAVIVRRPAIAPIPIAAAINRQESRTFSPHACICSHVGLRCFLRSCPEIEICSHSN